MSMCVCFSISTCVCHYCVMLSEEVDVSESVCKCVCLCVCAVCLVGNVLGISFSYDRCVVPPSVWPRYVVMKPRD